MLKQWLGHWGLVASQVRREIRRRFARLLKSFTDENGDAVYKQRVREMATSESAHAIAVMDAQQMTC